MSAPVTPRVRWAAVSTVLVVAAVAAVMSYGHLRAVATEQGEDAAVLFPLSVDGLIAAASLVLLVRRRCGQPGGALAWTGLLVGVAATVAGNVASAEPTLLARLVAAWPPVAFALSYELLLALLRPASAPAEAPDPAPAGAPAPTERAGRAPAGEPVGDAGESAGETPPTPGDATGAVTSELNLLEHRAREVIATASARPPGRRALARELGCTEHQARTVLAALSDNGTSGTSTATGGQN